LCFFKKIRFKTNKKDSIAVIYEYFTLSCESLPEEIGTFSVTTCENLYFVNINIPWEDQIKV